jgi:hypothetical protein
LPYFADRSGGLSEVRAAQGSSRIESSIYSVESRGIRRKVAVLGTPRFLRPSHQTKAFVSS